MGELIDDIPEDSRWIPAFVVGSYLAGVNRHDEAKPYWRLTAAGPNFWWKLIARSTMRERYRDPDTNKSGPKT